MNTMFRHGISSTFLWLFQDRHRGRHQAVSFTAALRIPVCMIDDSTPCFIFCKRVFEWNLYLHLFCRASWSFRWACSSPSWSATLFCTGCLLTSSRTVSEALHPIPPWFMNAKMVIVDFACQPNLIIQFFFQFDLFWISSQRWSSLFGQS